MSTVSSYRSRSSFTCSAHRRTTKRLFAPHPCSGFATDPPVLVGPPDPFRRGSPIHRPAHSHPCLGGCRPCRQHSSSDRGSCSHSRPSRRLSGSPDCPRACSLAYRAGAKIQLGLPRHWSGNGLCQIAAHHPGPAAPKGRARCWSGEAGGTSVTSSRTITPAAGLSRPTHPILSQASSIRAKAGADRRSRRGPTLGGSTSRADHSHNMKRNGLTQNEGYWANRPRVTAISRSGEFSHTSFWCEAWLPITLAAGPITSP